MKQVEFYYDLVSPYSYLAYGKLYEICEQQDAEVVLRPMLLGAVHNTVGIQAPVQTPSKGRYSGKDVYRWADYYGLSMKFPKPFPFRSLKTMRAAMFLQTRGELEAFTREGFSYFWEENGAAKGDQEEDENDPISEVVRRIGLDPDEVLEAARGSEAKAALKEATDSAVERGVFGAPTFFVGDEMFWGNDRLHFVEAALEMS
ncbi:MAG: 2-hydroxychromene-2-carboxylate isomerase [Actinomycetota bacterium]|nr:2-hydroxychromene-2-carboxylate isomerase [Actinomycetota bacterium]